MSRRYGILLLALAPFLLFACKKAEEPQQPIPIKKAPPVQQEAKAPVEIDAAAEAETTVGGKRRNPFQSHIVLMKGAEVPKKVKGPLECCELQLFRLIAVVVGGEQGYALVQAPDAKRYVIKRGDVLGTKEGRVVRISQRSITVRELSRDETGAVVSTDDMEIKLPEKDTTKR